MHSAILHVVILVISVTSPAQGTKSQQPLSANSVTARVETITLKPGARPSITISLPTGEKLAWQGAVVACASMDPIPGERKTVSGASMDPIPYNDLKTRDRLKVELKRSQVKDAHDRYATDDIISVMRSSGTRWRSSAAGDRTADLV